MDQAGSKFALCNMKITSSQYQVKAVPALLLVAKQCLLNGQLNSINNDIDIYSKSQKWTVSRNQLYYCCLHNCNACAFLVHSTKKVCMTILNSSADNKPHWNWIYLLSDWHHNFACSACSCSFPCLSLIIKASHINVCDKRRRSERRPSRCPTASLLPNPAGIVNAQLLAIRIAF